MREDESKYKSSSYCFVRSIFATLYADKIDHYQYADWRSADGT